MAEHTEVINTSSQESNVSLNESDASDRRKTIPKCRIIRGLPRHPIQRHCPVRHVSVKRRKRRHLSSAGESMELKILRYIHIFPRILARYSRYIIFYRRFVKQSRSRKHQSVIEFVPSK